MRRIDRNRCFVAATIAAILLFSGAIVRIRTAADDDGPLNQSNELLEGEIIWVPDQYRTIQDAINHRHDEAIFVRNGTYGKIVIITDSNTPPLLLKGEDPDSTVIDGNGTGPVVLVRSDNVTIIGFTIRGSGEDDIGIDVPSKKCNIAGNTVSANGIGIRLRYNDNVVLGNNVTHNTVGGIMMTSASSYNTILDNNITNNLGWGINLTSSYNNTVSNNCLVGNVRGVNLDESYNSTFCRNNFINNTNQVYDESRISPLVIPSRNIWNEDYPWGGNYWSDYLGKDDCWSEKQDSPGCDMIGDQPHVIDKNNTDNYPLLMPWPMPNVFRPYLLALANVSNVTDLVFNRALQQISFNLDAASSDCCRLIIPRYVMDGALSVLIDEVPAGFSIQWSPDCHMINFSYNEGSHKLKITSEIVDTPPVSKYPDLNSDGVVDILDISKVAYYYKKPYKSPIP